MAIPKTLKITLIAIAALILFQLFFRYDIKHAGVKNSGTFIYDRLTGRQYTYYRNDFSLFPYPHDTKKPDSVETEMSIWPFYIGIILFVAFGYMIGYLVARYEINELRRMISVLKASSGSE